MRAAQPRTARTPIRAGHAKQGAGNTSLTCAADLAQRARWTPSARWSRVLLPKGLEQNFPAIVVDFLRKPAFNDPAPRPHAVPPCGRVFKCFPRQDLSSLVDLHHGSTVSEATADTQLAARVLGRYATISIHVLANFGVASACSDPSRSSDRCSLEEQKASASPTYDGDTSSSIPARRQRLP